MLNGICTINNPIHLDSSSCDNWSTVVICSWSTDINLDKSGIPDSLSSEEWDSTLNKIKVCLLLLTDPQLIMVMLVIFSKQIFSSQNAILHAYLLHKYPSLYCIGKQIIVLFWFEIREHNTQELFATVKTWSIFKQPIFLIHTMENCNLTPLPGFVQAKLKMRQASLSTKQSRVDLMPLSASTFFFTANFRGALTCATQLYFCFS